MVDKKKRWILPHEGGCSGSERLDASLQHDLSTTLRDENANRSLWSFPTLTDDIPEGKIVLGYRNLGLLDLPWFQCYISEALERLWGLSGGGWEF